MISRTRTFRARSLASRFRAVAAFASLLLVIGFIALTGTAAAQPARTKPGVSMTIAEIANEVGITDLDARLIALKPSAPAAYFLLAEEIAGEARSRDSRGLAVRLYVLAMHLDRTAASPTGLDASACLGLASIARTDKSRHWLAATARVLDSGRRGTAATLAKPRLAMIEPTDQVGYDLATALGLARYGDGRRAEQILNRPEVAQVLSIYDGILNADGQFNAVQNVERWVRDWPTCPECKNRRTVNRTDGPGTPVRQRLCNVCGGMPGPNLTSNELVAMLRAESSLLHGVHRFWSSQYLADLGQPLRDPTPEAVASTFGVDVKKSVFRDGLWIEP